MKNQKVVVLAVVVSLFTWIGCSTENLNEEIAVEAIEDQDPFITKHQAIFDVIVADDVITDAEFATLTQLEGFAAFDETLIQALEPSNRTELEGVASKFKTRAQIAACNKKALNKFRKGIAVCKTRKKKNRASCRKAINLSYEASRRVCTNSSNP